MTTTGIYHSHVVLQEWATLKRRIDPEADKCVVDGKSLTLADVVAVARHGVQVDVDHKVLIRGAESVQALENGIQKKKVIYGVNTGFGGSADTRTSAIREIQYTLIRDLHSGILTPICHASNTGLATGARKLPEIPEKALPLEDGLMSTRMPETWVRASLLLRLNSLLGGYSAVRPIVPLSFAALLNANIIPLVPLRGSVSASGDLMPLAYISGVLLGKRNLRAWSGKGTTRSIVSADIALFEAGLNPLKIEPKEGLAIVNGTAFSCAVAALAIHDAHSLVLMAEILTAMSVEALRGTEESFHPFVAEVRPHLGQVDSARNIFFFLRGSRLLRRDNDELEAGMLRQDRYATRSAAQWLGPVLEDLLLAHTQVLTECNSITDNPLIQPSGNVIHSANFQAKSITSAMEKTRQGVESIGRMLFAQCTELINPVTSRGMPPNLTADEPSESWLMKPVDIMIAALQGELGFLATPVNHVHAAEMGNQSIHSLAFISARYTHTALDVLSQLVAAHLFATCQSLDLRAMHIQYLEKLRPLLYESLSTMFRDLFQAGSTLPAENTRRSDFEALFARSWIETQRLLDSTTSMDSFNRFMFVAKSLQSIVVDYVVTLALSEFATSFSLPQLKRWSDSCAQLMLETYVVSRDKYWACGNAIPLLGIASCRMYRFVREELKVPFLRESNLRTLEESFLILDGNTDPSYSAASTGRVFEQSIGEADDVETPTIGDYITRIYISLKSGVLYEKAVDCLQDAQSI